MRGFLRLLRKATVLAVLCGASYAALLDVDLRAGHRRTEGYEAALLDKERLLHETPHPRVVVGGGSNVVFGLDSAALERALGKPVIDVALHGSLGVAFMARGLVDGVGPGDELVLSAEYENFFDDVWRGDSALLEALQVAPDTWAYVDVRDQGPTFLRFGAEKLRNDALALLRPPPRDDVYRRASFDAHGDMIAHLGRAAARTPTSSPLSGALAPRAFELVAEAAQAASAHGARLSFAPPAVMQSAYQASRDAMVAVVAGLRARGVRVLGEPERFAFDDSLFFDTASHLGAEGRRLRTERLAAAMREEPNGAAE